MFLNYTKTTYASYNKKNSQLKQIHAEAKKDKTVENLIKPLQVMEECAHHEEVEVSFTFVGDIVENEPMQVFP